MRARVPANLIRSTYSVFPEGNYSGEIVSASLRDPKGDGSWLTLKLGVGSVTANEGTDNPGRDRFQSDILIKTDGVNVFDIEDFNDEAIPFQIRKASGLLAGLAIGLGVVEEGKGGSDLDLKDVAEALIDGKFQGDRVGFTVGHWTGSKEGATPRDQYKEFGHAG